ncbi:MAG: DUF3781 domain-containing protein [Rhodobacteraceae bacterium]|nr:DUF3781 domain-containing protein [Paracoccaceae bacterium]
MCGQNLATENITEDTKKFIAANFKNTEMGLVRIARNLNLRGMADDDIVRHCHKIILSTPISKIEVRGKNYYLYSREYSAVLTINKSSLGIITAKIYE